MACSRYSQSIIGGIALAILREVTVAVTDVDTVTLTRTATTDGYAGEHLATNLAITVPAAWDSYNAYVAWSASDGTESESPAFLISNPTALSFDYALPQVAMKRGVLGISIVARKVIDVDNTFEAHTEMFNLHISQSVNPNVIYTQDRIDAIEDHEARIDVLESGVAYAKSVSSDGVLTDMALVCGDGGARGVKSTSILFNIDGGLDNVYGIGCTGGLDVQGSVDIWGETRVGGVFTCSENIETEKTVQSGTARFGSLGNGSDFTEFEDDGTMVMHGDATVFDDFVVRLGNLKAPAADPPTTRAYKGGEVYGFSKSATNVLYFEAQLPHSYKEGSPLAFHLHVAYPTNGAGNVLWSFTHSWANVDEVFPSPTTETAISISPATLDAHGLCEIVEIDGTGKNISSVLLCSISRIGGHVDDTYDAEVYAISADFHYEKDTVGSRSMYTK